MLLSSPTSRPSRHMPAAMTLLLWAGAVGTLTLWWLHLPQPRDMSASAARVTPSSQTPPAPGAVERVLGHTQAVAVVPDAHKRFVLKGVIASASGQGSALIAVDGQPAKAYLIGQTIDGDWQVQNVAARSATLQGAGQRLELVLPASLRD